MCFYLCYNKARTICVLLRRCSLKNFIRNNLSFSLCGLNCALCTMKLDGYCPGCGGGAGNQGCSIARCSVETGNHQYCFECESYPCEKYDDITRYDSFITHRRQIIDMEKAKAIGAEIYTVELCKKVKILKHLLENYNDGRRKTFFCLAVNLLEISDIHSVVEQIENETTNDNSLREKALIAVSHFEDTARQKGIVIKLNKKPSKSNLSE